MSIIKTNVFIHPIEKVLFPYHDYAFQISSNLYQPELYDNLIGFATKVDSKEAEKNSELEMIEDISRYGVLLKIQKSEMSGYQITNNSKVYKYNFFGLTFARFRIISLEKIDEKFEGKIEIFNDDIEKDVENIIEKNKMFITLKKELTLFNSFKLKYHEAEIKNSLLDEEKSINKIIYKYFFELDLKVTEKLAVLQMSRQDLKIELLLSYISQKTSQNKSVVDLEEKVRQDMTKSSVKKPWPAKAPQQTKGKDIDEIEEKLKNKKLPQYVREEIEKELKRIGGDNQSSVTLKYIDTLLEIPWLENTEDVKDLTTAEKILNDDHTGLADVKERIMEFLAVKFRNGNSKGNIICLHGPPGVGKTSIAKSIAKALGKEFTRVSLGGMNDEAELRGHRRTYIAAMPGVIIRALIKAKSNNPVILLDEIEKIGTSYKGNPEHALLEILDPSQNSSFKDHYVGIPVDLSKVLFICTANSLDLSTPLLNRLELIEVPGYTRKEKFEIIKNHLLPNQLKENGVEDLISFDNDSLEELVKYTNEMGVRQLERNLSKICRKMARENKKQVITTEIVKSVLGPIDQEERWNGIGVVNGMAWTEMGGKLLLVESIKYPSQKFEIEVTGQLGDVMKESIHIAVSWIRANRNDFALWSGGDYNIPELIDDLEKASIHVHFPAGGVKKDGPSAGVTIVTCLVSLLLKVPVRDFLSMTGEITLSGQVLPVGGVREKCIAAIYEGMKHIVIPQGNLKDIEKIPTDLKKGISFYPVKNIQQALEVSFPSLLDKVSPKI